MTDEKSDWRLVVFINHLPPITNHEQLTTAGVRMHAWAW
jgi:hypothetical protein